MTAYQESLRLFRKIAPGIKVFLILYLVIMALPIHHLTGSNIQSIIADGIFHYIHYEFRRILWSVVMVYAYLTNDSVMIGLLLFFFFFSSNVNKDKKDKGHYYI